MNTLYGILVQTVPSSPDYAWYDKQYDLTVPTTKMQNIRDILLTGVPIEKIRMFASVVCNLVLYTRFGADIQNLDPNNSYVDVTRPDDSDHSDQSYCCYGLIQPVTAYKKLRMFLDDDISGLLNKDSWVDWMAAGCLQLLRETTE